MLSRVRQTVATRFKDTDTQGLLRDATDRSPRQILGWLHVSHLDLNSSHCGYIRWFQVERGQSAFYTDCTTFVHLMDTIQNITSSSKPQFHIA